MKPEVRKASGISTQEAAKIVGVHVATMSGYAKAGRVGKNIGAYRKIYRYTMEELETLKGELDAKR